MAQLKDTVVAGSLRATDTVYANTVQAKVIEAPTTSNGTTYGPGTNGQVLKSNGTSAYWASDSAGVTSVTINATSPVVSSATGAITSTGTRTISLADGYGDTKNPYAAKAKNVVLAGPSSGNNAAPTFRALVADDLPDASTSAQGVVQLSDATNSTSTTLAATANAVKKAYDLANGKTANTGTVTKVSTGAGLTGGDITTTGTVKAALTSETNLTNAAADGTETSGRVYPVRLDKNGKLAVNVPWTNTNSSYLTAHQTIKQDGVTGATVNRFGTCSTAAGTAAKTVSITTGTFNLEAGARVSVHFSNANTANSPTLNVNSKGAKNIFHKGAQITNGTNKALLAGVVDFIYDGTQWHLIGNYIDTDTNTKVTSVGNHYTPSGGTTIASTATEAPVGGIQYAEYITLTKDAAGHVTDLGQSVGTLKSETAASNGTTLSLVTTGEKATWNAKTTNTGTVTKVSTGVGLTGGDITSTGTVKAALTSETKLTNAAADGTETSGRVYPVRLDKNGKLAVNVPWTNVNSGYATSGHTHTLGIAADSGTNELSLAANTKYKITAGGDSFVFTTPKDTTYSAATTSAAGLMSAADKTKLTAMGNAAIFHGTCDTAAATVDKVVTCADFAAANLVKGAIIYVTFTHTNSAAVASITMNVNSTGAKRLRCVRNGAVQDLPGVGYITGNQTHVFTYDGTSWNTSVDYNSNTTYALNGCLYGTSGANYTADSVFYRYQLLFQMNDSEVTPLNNYNSVNGVVSNKTMLTSVQFDPFGHIFYWNSSGSIAANGAIRGDYLYNSCNIDLRYTFNVTSNLTTSKDVYLKVSPQTNGLVKLASATPLVQTLPTSNDGYWYIFLGRAYSTTNIVLEQHHPVYYHDGTGICEALKPEIRREASKAIVKYGPSSAFSSLPVTFEDDSITADMVVLNYVLSNPTAQINNWTVTTAAGSLTISGQVRGSTTITLYLGRCEQEA